MFYQFGKKENIRDRMFMILTLLCTFIPLVVAAGFFILLGGNSSEAFRTFGFKFILSTQWDPVQQLYGALPAISGTLVTTVIAVGIAAPLGFITALFLVNAPKWLGYPLSQALDLLAAIPSIIYGMWGLFVLAPVMQDYIQPFLADTLCLGKVPFFGEDYNGFGFLTAGLILALMILPYICAVMRDVFLHIRHTVPAVQIAAVRDGNSHIINLTFVSVFQIAVPPSTKVLSSCCYLHLIFRKSSSGTCISHNSGINRPPRILPAAWQSQERPP